MKSKAVFRSIADHTKRLRRIDKKLVRTYVSLFLILVLIATACFAWFAERYTAQMRAVDLEFQSASSLRINKDEFAANIISIPEFTLDEASSVDGRNIYFPLGTSFNENTAEMFFREGNRGDGLRGDPDSEHRSYVYLDFELKGTSGNTPVYIKSYKIQVKNADGTMTPDPDGVNGVYQDELVVHYSNAGVPEYQELPPANCPIRLAFIADSGVKPVVIDPSAQVIDYVNNTTGAVYLVDDNGVPELKSSYPDFNWDSFSTYYYEHTPLFVIPGGETLDVTLVIWLEGSLGNCDKYIGKKISVDIDIESNFAEMDTIKFIDQTQDDDGSGGHWVDHDNTLLACSYKDPYSDEGRYKTVIMKKSASYATDYTWTCQIPRKAYTDISFYRLNPGNSSEPHGTIWNSWHTSENIGTLLQESDIRNGENHNGAARWYRSGAAGAAHDLQSTRRYYDSATGTYQNYLEFTATHGNGHGLVTSTTQDKDKKRLAPGVGYWGYTGGSSSGGGGGGSDVTHETCDVTIILRIPNDLSGKEWVWNTDRVGCETEMGNDCDFGAISNRTVTGTFTLPVGDKIVRFYKKNSSGNKYYPFSGGANPFTVPNQATYSVTYTMNNSDKWTC